MRTIASVFSKAKHKALIPYVTVGYPDLQATIKAVLLLDRLGCDIVELGVPFSDPLADGATIQKASYHALENGITPQACLEAVRQIRQKTNIPLALMTYLNPVFNYGYKEFCRACVGSGVNGLIIPDLPPEEGTELEDCARAHGIDLVYFLSPNSTDERIKLVSAKASGFIYLVSVTGVTGARDSLPENLEHFVSRVRKVAAQPLCLGFGISTPEQAYQVACIADGVIVGSQIIKFLETKDNLASLRIFVKRLRTAIDEACK